MVGCLWRQKIILCRRLKTSRSRTDGRTGSIRSGAAMRGGGGAFEIQHAGDEVAHRDSQVSPEAVFEAGLALRAAENIAHQLAENRAAAHELHHAGGDCRAQERAAIETSHDAGREFE